MNIPNSSSHSILHGIMMAAVLLYAAGAAAQTAMPPNLKPLGASNLSLVTNLDGTTDLRFATTSWNNGTGALQLEAGTIGAGDPNDPLAIKQQVNQRVFNSDGTSGLFSVGWFTWHESHNHFHYDDYAVYTLRPINAPGGSQRNGQKTTFCVMDTTKIDGALPGAPSSAVYSTCGNQKQGMSVGWGDTYGAHLTGQEIDFTDNADGIYQLMIEVNPKKNLIETNNSDGDNTSCVLLNIKKPSTVTVLDGSGGCGVVKSISPTSAPRNTTVQMTITGFGFTSGTTITFEGGSGPRPVASNVVLTVDSPDGEDTLTATVTIPNKKQLGRNPVWDVRVGSGGVLRRGFTVTP